MRGGGGGVGDDDSLRRRPTILHPHSATSTQLAGGEVAAPFHGTVVATYMAPSAFAGNGIKEPLKMEAMSKINPLPGTPSVFSVLSAEFMKPDLDT